MPLSKDIIARTLKTPEGEGAYKIVEKLTDAGFDTWWVGGCVRDMLLGKVPTDIDIATSAKPAQIMHLFPKGDDTGSAFGSIHVPLGASIFHVTTFREDDSASDGRHPESVLFGTREKDAERRDFTVNALYFHPISRELYDPFEGEKDLKEKLVRFIGDPSTRIKHDALRMLRAVRLRATINGQYHPETYGALKVHAALMEVLSGSRKLEEFEKMLLCPHPDRALEDLWELHLLQEFLPELAVCKGIPQPADYHREGDVWEHMLLCTKAFKEEHGIDVRLAAIFHDSGKAQTFSLKERIRFDQHASVSGEIAKKALDRLQITAKRREKIVWIIRHHMMMNAFSDMSDERKAHWYFHPWFPELLQLFWLDIAGTAPADFRLLKSIVKDEHSFLDSHPRPPKVLLTGDEVMDILGLHPGEEVGLILNALYEEQLAKRITTKKEAKAFVKDAGKKWKQEEGMSHTR